MEDLHRVGGTPGVLKYLLEKARGAGEPSDAQQSSGAWIAYEFCYIAVVLQSGTVFW